MRNPSRQQDQISNEIDYLGLLVLLTFYLFIFCITLALCEKPRCGFQSVFKVFRGKAAFSILRWSLPYLGTYCLSSVLLHKYEGNQNIYVNTCHIHASSPDARPSYRLLWDAYSESLKNGVKCLS